MSEYQIQPSKFIFPVQSDPGQITNVRLPSTRSAQFRSFVSSTPAFTFLTQWWSILLVCLGPISLVIACLGLFMRPKMITNLLFFQGLWIWRWMICDLRRFIPAPSWWALWPGRISSSMQLRLPFLALVVTWLRLWLMPQLIPFVFD